MGGPQDFQNSLKFRFVFQLIPLQCYYSVTNAFQPALLNYNLFKVCIEVCKTQ